MQTTDKEIAMESHLDAPRRDKLRQTLEAQRAGGPTPRL